MAKLMNLSLKSWLSIPNFVLQLWRKFGAESLGSIEARYSSGSVHSNSRSVLTFNPITFDPQVEEQEWPVTPYQIKVYTLPHCPLSFFSVYVDGVKVGKKVLKHGKDWYVLLKIMPFFSTLAFMYLL